MSIKEERRLGMALTRDDHLSSVLDAVWEVSETVSCLGSKGMCVPKSRECLEGSDVECRNYSTS